MSSIVAQSPNFNDLATNFTGAAKQESKEKKIHRFFKETTLPEEVYARFVFNQLDIKKAKLAIDRTTWFPGRRNINYLVLSVIWHGQSIPLLKTLLPKKGNSKATEQIDLMERFEQIFGTDCIEGYYADREFPNKEHLAYLMGKEIPICMRIKKNTLISGKQAKYYGFDLHPGELKVLQGKQKVLGQDLYITLAKDDSGDLIIIATSGQVNGVDDYSLRWSIEVLFGNLKSRGFNLEKTGMTDPERLRTLMQIQGIALMFSVLYGSNLPEGKVKKHKYQAKSVFRRGLEYLRAILLNIESRLCEFLHFAESISFLRVLSSS